MYSSQEWWSNTAGGSGGDPGDPIEQSLRFRASSGNGLITMSRPVVASGDRSWTWSGWVKSGGPYTKTLFTPTSDASPGSTSSGLYINPGGKMWYQTSATNVADSWRSYSNLSDTSAWYHIVFTVDVDNNETNGYINGVKAGDTNVFNSTFQTFSGTMGFRYGGSSYPTAGGDFYIAEVHLIDGKVLDPTDFGRFNDYGVWVPKNPDFQRVLDANYVQGVTTPSGNWNPVYANPPSSVFDGGVSEYASPLTYTDSISVNFNDAIPFTHSLRVFMCHYAESSYTLNGNAVDTSGMSVGICGWQPVATGPGTLQSFVMGANTSDSSWGNYLYAFEVDGQILTEGKSYFSWSRYLTTDDPAGFNPSYPAWNGFDGNPAVYTQPNTATNKIFFNPPKPIEYRKSLRIFCCKYADQEMLLNGQSIPAATSEGTCDWNVNISGSGTLESFELGNSAVGGAYLYAIEIDGVLLRDGVNFDYNDNGFHLDFADPLDIGHDASGQGNDFTASGFDTTAISSGYWVDAVYQATGTQIPNSQGQPYWTDISPADASLDFNNSSTIQNAFDGDLTTMVYWVGDEYSTGNILSGTFDLRDFPTVTSVEVLSAGGSPNLEHSYTVELLDSNKNAIAGTSVKTSQAPLGSPEWVSAPVSGTPRYMRISTTPLSGSVYKRLYLYAIRINGEILSQSGTTELTYDYMKDSPTQNYATYNPLGFNNGALSSAIGMQYANLDFIISSDPDIGFTIFTIPTSGKYYFELTPPDTECVFRLYAPKEDNQSANFVGNSAQFYSQGTRWIATSSGSLAPDGNADKNVTGSVKIQVAIDADNQRIYLGDGETNNWLRNAGPGTYSVGTFDASQPSIDYSTLDENGRNNAQIAITGVSGVRANFGQQPFDMTLPIGWDDTTVLQTKNLPTPSIPDGREHFQAIVNGSGVGRQYLQGQIDISSAFTADPSEERAWGTTQAEGTNYVGVVTLDAGDVYDNLSVWSTSNNSNMKIYISVDGTTWTDTGVSSQSSPIQTFTGPARYIRYEGIAGDGTWQADYFRGVGTLNILEQAQEVFPNGMWWIKDRVNTNHHQLVDSVRGGDFVLQPDTAASETSYVPPTGDSVAWCWKAGDTSVADNTGSVESQVCVNQAAGFSIVTWVGTGAFDSIGHGLGKRPGMVITRSRQGDHWIVGHDSITTLTSGGTPDQWVNSNSFVGTNWTNAILLNSENAATDYVASSGINKSGDTMMAYVWAPIEGFSSFGKYDGNSATDGPFIYTGFRPAFVLIKRATATGNWHLYDTTRGLINPVGPTLYPDLDFAEQNVAYLDILSNGFKIRTDQGPVNLGSVYLYACFAENPFQSPVTAR